MTKNIKNNLILVLIIILNLAADQVSKYYARIYIQGQGLINVIGDFFIMTYAENSGAFLSLGSNLPQPWKTLVLVLFPTLAIFAGILYLIFGKHVTFKQSIAIACIIGGGLGNIYDRAMHLGAVTDFLNFGFGNIRTGILNIADLSITFGAIALFIIQYIEEKEIKNDRTIKTDS